MWRNDDAGDDDDDDDDDDELFLYMKDQQRAFGFISSWDHYQRSHRNI